jgi:2-polyprenyl-3-methyl-5-hydroxy-6-metoxy-1,4-benzoquinol methylase
MSKLSVPYGQIAASLPEHLATFLKTSVDEVAERTKDAREERNRRWIAADPQNEEERNTLYSELGELDLLKYAEWHRTDIEKQELHDEIVTQVKRAGARVLDCGGGIGDTTLAFASNGVDVTYIDFPGVCSEFARYRWGEFDCADHVTPMTPEEFWDAGPARFGAVCSIDVLEHLENPVRHARRYFDLLEPGGSLYVTACFEHSERNPDHLLENDGYRRVFGGEPKTGRRSVLTNIGFDRKRWYWFVKP